MIRHRGLRQSRQAVRNSSDYANCSSICEICVLIVEKLSTLLNPRKRFPRWDLSKIWLLHHNDFANYGLGLRSMSAPPSNADFHLHDDNVRFAEGTIRAGNLAGLGAAQAVARVTPLSRPLQVGFDASKPTRREDRIIDHRRGLPMTSSALD